MEAEKMINVLSIDAWRSDGQWDWNNWYKVGTVPLSLCDAKPRAVFRKLRDMGILGAGSAGLVALEDDQYNVVIVARGTREPLFALEYGPVVN